MTTKLISYYVTVSHFSTDAQYCYIKAANYKNAIKHAKKLFGDRQYYCGDCGNLISAFANEQPPAGYKYNTVYKGH